MPSILSGFLNVNLIIFNSVSGCEPILVTPLFINNNCQRKYLILARIDYANHYENVIPTNNKTVHIHREKKMSMDEDEDEDDVKVNNSKWQCVGNKITTKKYNQLHSLQNNEFTNSDIYVTILVTSMLMNNSFLEWNTFDAKDEMTFTFLKWLTFCSSNRIKPQNIRQNTIIKTVENILSDIQVSNNEKKDEAKESFSIMPQSCPTVSIPCKCGSWWFANVISNKNWEYCLKCHIYRKK